MTDVFEWFLGSLYFDDHNSPVSIAGYASGGILYAITADPASDSYFFLNDNPPTPTPTITPSPTTTPTPTNTPTGIPAVIPATGPAGIGLLLLAISG